MTILILAFLPDVEVGAFVDTTDGLAASFEEVEPVLEILPEVDGVTLLVPVGGEG
jgi:hypothetical protein